jgi:hypothetical protein
VNGKNFLHLHAIPFPGRTSATTLLQAASNGAATLDSELSSYLDSDTTNQFDNGDFNII